MASCYAETVQEGFQRMGFPSTLGSIDGTYIPIPLPEENGNAYICRKGFPCIILQVFFFCMYMNKLMKCFIIIECL